MSCQGPEWNAYQLSHPVEGSTTKFQRSQGHTGSSGGAAVTRRRGGSFCETMEQERGFGHRCDAALGGILMYENNLLNIMVSMLSLA